MSGRNSIGTTIYRYGYQGQFSEMDNETGYNSFDLRMYDPNDGRWSVPDPYHQYNSPYMAMSNNFAGVVDPDGAWADIQGVSFFREILINFHLALDQVFDDGKISYSKNGRSVGLYGEFGDGGNIFVKSKYKGNSGAVSSPEDKFGRRANGKSLQAHESTEDFYEANEANMYKSIPRGQRLQRWRTFWRNKTNPPPSPVLDRSSGRSVVNSGYTPSYDDTYNSDWFNGRRTSRNPRFINKMRIRSSRGNSSDIGTGD